MRVFRYVLAKPPTDYFWWAMEADEMIKKAQGDDPTNDYSYINKIKNAKDLINKEVKFRTGECPHTIKYFAIPYDFECEICAIAKILNNGETFVFSSNYEFLESISDGYCDIYTLGR